MQGRFDKAAFDLSCDGNLFLEVIQTGKQTFIEEQQSNVSLNILINKDEQSYTFSNSTISILDDEFTIDGKVIDEQMSTDLDLNIHGQNLNMAAIISLLPPNYREELQGFRSEGNAFIDIDINGKSSMQYSPSVTANFGIANGTLYHPNVTHSLNQVNTSGRYKNKVGKDPSILELDQINGKINDKPFEATLKMHDLNQPILDITLSAETEIKEFSTFLESQQIKKPEGIIQLRDFDFKGQLSQKELLNQLKNIKSSGQVVLKDVQFDYHDQHIEKFNGTFDFNNQELITSDFLIAFHQNDFNINGTFAGLFESIANLDSEKELIPLKIKTGTIRSQSIDMNEIQKLSKGMTSKNSNPEEKTFFDVSKYLTGPFKINVEHFKWNEIEASSISSNINLKKHEIQFTQTKSNVFDGYAVMNGSLYFESSGIRLTTSADCEQMNIKQMFAECRNFGQDEITEQEIDGTLNATINFTTAWNNMREVESDKILMEADLSIKDGELKNYSSLETLSNYVKLEDLKHVQFSELQNTIKIEDRTVYIPAMHIESSAMNIDIQGTHSFDHEIDYFFKINLLEVLATKIKKQNSEFDDIETKPSGNINFYVSLVGTVQDYDISFQKSKNKQALLGPNRKKGFGQFVKDELKGKPQSTNQKSGPDEAEELEFIDWE